MKKMEITVEDELFEKLQDFSKTHEIALPQILEEGLHWWLLRFESEKFGEEWIASLKKNPENGADADAWIDAQAWAEQ